MRNSSNNRNRTLLHSGTLIAAVLAIGWPTATATVAHGCSESSRLLNPPRRWRGLSIDCGCFGTFSAVVSVKSILVLMVAFLFSCMATAFSWYQAPKTSLPATPAPSTASNSGRYRHTGMTVVEVLCVVAIIGVLIAMLMPAVQNVRESARRVSCLNKLRNVTLAAINFESAHQHLPPGILGYESLVRFEVDGGPGLGWSDPGSPNYWKNAQHTSSLCMLLPYLEQKQLSDQLPGIVTSSSQSWGNYRSTRPGQPEWIGDLPDVRDVMTQTVGIFLCPSDPELSINGTAQAAITMQPSFVVSPPRDALAAEFNENSLITIAPTSYAGCTGAHSGGPQPQPELHGYSGYMTTARRVSTMDATDGSSNTILYGENIGMIWDRKRTYYQSWMFSALARGRGVLPWRQNRFDPLPEFLLLGDAQYAYLTGFGSMHPSTVNFSFGDGRVQPVSRLIEIDPFYSLCGMRDGDVISGF